MNALIHPITFDDYCEIEGVNQTTLKRFGTAATPKHYKHELDNPKPETAAIRIGRAVDCLAFRPSDFGKEFATWNGDRRGKAWEEFRDAHDGISILNSGENDRVQGCLAALAEDGEFQTCLRGSRTQVAAVCDDEEHGCQRKALIDILPPKSLGWVFDLKTTDSAEQSDFARTAMTVGHHIQAAFTLDILAALGEPRDYFGLFIVEADAPHAICHKKFATDSAELDDAREKIRKWLPEYLICRNMDVWPGYTSEWEDVKFPHWALRRAA
jgi:hypothetical protein